MAEGGARIYFKMAPVVVIAVISSLLMLHSTSPVLATRVEVTAPVQPVIIGGVLAIQCRIWDIQDDHTVRLFRVTADRSDQITAGKDYMSSWLEQRVFLSTRSLPGGIRVYFITIVDVSIHDQGEYLCKIYSTSRGNFETVTDGSVNVEISSLPGNAYPLCRTEPTTPTSLNENDVLKLVCSSEKSSPIVSLTWSTSDGNIPLSPRNMNEEGMVSSEISLSMQKTYYGVAFTCIMISSAFPDLVRSCHIGPFVIANNMEGTDSNAIPAIPTKPIIVKQGNMKLDECQSDCQLINKETILYLSVATVSATILWVVFLTTTIMMCCKYNDISTQAREARRTVPVDDGSEPVYVSLQTRQDYDRNSVCSMYMTLDDPNNPGNKIVMPKEAFDDFYRTLTIKRV